VARLAVAATLIPLGAGTAIANVVRLHVDGNGHHDVTWLVSYVIAFGFVGGVIVTTVALVRRQETKRAESSAPQSEISPANNLQWALTRKIREGDELHDEALALGGPERLLGGLFSAPPSVERSLRKQSLSSREKAWTEGVENLLVDRPSQASRFSDERGLPHDDLGYATANRVKARLAVLREIRDAL